MIPVHPLHSDLNQEIEVHRLNELTNYDFGKPHRHSYYEFFYFEKGGGIHEIDFHSFPIHDNSIHIVASGRVHQVKRELDSSGLVFLFNLDQFSKEKVFHDFLFEDGIYDVEEFPVTFQLKQIGNENIIQRVENAMNFSEDQEHLAHLTFKNSIQNFIIQCLESINHSEPLIASKYSDFRKLVLRDVRERRTVTSYAEELGITVKMLNELAKKHFGNTPSKIIQNQVCLEAKRLLLSGMSVKEVAYFLNFSDPAHFSKFFKSILQTSPREFQKVHNIE